MLYLNAYVDIRMSTHFNFTLSIFKKFPNKNVALSGYRLSSVFCYLSANFHSLNESTRKSVVSAVPSAIHVASREPRVLNSTARDVRGQAPVLSCARQLNTSAPPCRCSGGRAHVHCLLVVLILTVSVHLSQRLHSLPLRRSRHCLH